MKEYCRNLIECCRKVLNRYFGCEDEIVLYNCCDICQLELQLVWKFIEVLISIQKVVIWEKLLNYLLELNCVIDIYVIEKIVNEVYLFR